MRIKLKRIFGKILSVLGFYGLFLSRETWMSQFIWTMSAAAMLLLGQKLLVKAGAIEEE